MSRPERHKFWPNICRHPLVQASRLGRITSGLQP
jgi:hypothetical protein